ncbi:MULTISPECIES: hypothetical protein [Acidobacterium]|uniref:Uncharacterized protein n=1 Tax=Acidobacterium capsulatum (strain ATCC 51196 / DSM 11244 / BCRC 80197 / JCM 7670 / NBRC 15755 / NCIMB 13165 / 161) TaxID=240015 RepID=C1FA34_ACIC5|nr:MULTISPECIES: hypothetical protein [Acidobacterium]ACO34618.1 hypothetical protein ACP_0415 [Acidobacterium capsulatum ATCC 51196]HCT62042.1 hypothetical protein [Acidobacterium sp.]
MSERDVLNPTPAWQEDINDSMSPDYGFGNNRVSTVATLQAVSGRPYDRQVGVRGHSFTFTWSNRSYQCAQRIRQFFEQHERGYFTIIDQDGGGRHYVGRFTGQLQISPVGNDMWTVSGLQFVEIPGAPMLQYPSDWDNDSVWELPIDDAGDQQLAIQGNWTQTQHPVVSNGVQVERYSFDNPGTNAVDWAQYEYRGYGFQLQLLCGPAQGQADVYLDGTLLQTVDCYLETASAVPQTVLTKVNVPLDLHRVKVITKNAKNAASTAPAVSWWALRVMR